MDSLLTRGRAFRLELAAQYTRVGSVADHPPPPAHTSSPGTLDGSMAWLEAIGLDRDAALAQAFQQESPTFDAIAGCALQAIERVTDPPRWLERSAPIILTVGTFNAVRLGFFNWSRADTTSAIIDPVEARGDRALVARALALGARDVGGELSAAETALTNAAAGIDVVSQTVDEARASILVGGDPLGVEFYRLRSPVVRRQAGAVYTPVALVEPMDAAKRAVEVVLMGLDRNRFPWVGEDREPTEAERQAAALASGAMIAARRVMTKRANESKTAQEKAGGDAIEAAGLTPVPARTIRNLTSNSSTNSIKRLNNDAAVKAATWIDELGSISTVPAAVLSGVFKVRNLEQAQERGLTIYWAHELDRLVEFIVATR